MKSTLSVAKADVWTWYHCSVTPAVLHNIIYWWFGFFVGCLWASHCRTPKTADITVFAFFLTLKPVVCFLFHFSLCSGESHVLSATVNHHGNSIGLRLNPLTHSRGMFFRMCFWLIYSKYDTHHAESFSICRYLCLMLWKWSVEVLALDIFYG